MGGAYCIYGVNFVLDNSPVLNRSFPSVVFKLLMLNTIQRTEMRYFVVEPPNGELSYIP